MSEAYFIGMLVLGLSSLMGLFSLIYKPLKDHTTAMVENTMQLKTLSEDFKQFEHHNKESHQRIWDHMGCQDYMIDDHERRLHELDGKWSREKEN